MNWSSCIITFILGYLCFTCLLLCSVVAHISSVASQVRLPTCVKGNIALQEGHSQKITIALTVTGHVAIHSATGQTFGGIKQQLLSVVIEVVYCFCPMHMSHMAIDAVYLLSVPISHDELTRHGAKWFRIETWCF